MFPLYCNKQEVISETAMATKASRKMAINWYPNCATTDLVHFWSSLT